VDRTSWNVLNVNCKYHFLFQNDLCLDKGTCNCHCSTFVIGECDKLQLKCFWSRYPICPTRSASVTSNCNCNWVIIPGCNDFSSCNGGVVLVAIGGIS
jgi:hypothetical protein